jgi:hypothetical protein
MINVVIKSYSTESLVDNEGFDIIYRNTRVHKVIHLIKEYQLIA